MDFVPSRRCRPCAAATPKTPAKIELMRQRAARHESLFHPGDAAFDNDAFGARIRVAGNGKPLILGAVALKNPEKILLSPAGNKASFGERLQALRLRAGMGIFALATATGISRQAVHRLESGQRLPTWATVLRLAKVLGVSVSEFEPG